MAINQKQLGATLERKAWVAKLRRLKKSAEQGASGIIIVLELLEFGKLREPRTGKKKGGL